MKVIIGTRVKRESTGKILEKETVIEDFTEEELKKYSGFYRTEETKEKLTDKKLKLNKT